MKNGLDQARMVAAVTKLQVTYNGGLIYTRKAETEKNGYIREILNRNNLQIGGYLDVENQEEKE